MTGATGQVFGRYELLGRIGTGGMGEVWRARAAGPAGWSRDVAIKRLLPHLAQDTDFVARFLDEARIAAVLNHGNIVTTLDVGEVDGEIYVALEFVDGLDLRDALRAAVAQGGVPVACAVLIASELCKALSFAHACCDADGQPLHLVHRDISPSNIMVSRAGEVKLADFGIAAARSRSTRTLTGQLRGKLGYMSPEQARGEPLDGRSDLFALGSVLYEMLSGRRAFEGDSEPEILTRVQNARFVPLDELRPELDAELVGIVHRAMALERGQRFATADELGVALLRFLMRETGPVMPAHLAAWLERLAPRVRRDATPDTPRQRVDDTGTRTASAPPALARSGSVSSRVEPAPPVAQPRAAPIRAIGVSVAAVLLLMLAGVAAWSLAGPGRGEIVVSSTPEEARVYVDGVELGVTPLRARVEAGVRDVRVALPGYESVRQQVDVVARAQAPVAVALVPEPVPIEFESIPPGAEVSIDGGAFFVAGNAVPLRPGAAVHVRMRLDGHAEREEEIVITPGVTRFAVRLEPLPPAVEAEGDAGAPVAAPAPGSTPAPATTVPVEPVAQRTWEITGAPENAELYVDGRPQAVGEPVRRALRDGPVEVELRVGDAVVWSRTLDPETDVAREVRATIAARGQLQLAYAAPPMTGELLIDGRSYGQHDWQEALELPAGRHAIEVRNAAFDRVHSATIEVVAGETTRHVVVW